MGYKCMGIKKSIKFFTRHVRPGQWVGYGSIKENGGYIAELFNRRFRPPQQSPLTEDDRNLTFDEFSTKSGLTEAKIQSMMSQGWRFMVYCLGMALVVLVYAAYVFCKGTFVPGVVSLLLAVLLLVYAWREHFIYTKLKHRRLNLTVSDWFNLLLK